MHYKYRIDEMERFLGLKNMTEKVDLSRHASSFGCRKRREKDGWKLSTSVVEKCSMYFETFCLDVNKAVK